MNTAMRWIDEVRGTDSLRAVARRAGVTSAKLIRQVNDDQLSFETVREVSRAYERSVISDLIVTGHLTVQDAGADGIERVLHAATDEHLVLEIARRLDAPTISAIFDKPISSAVATASNVHHLAPRNVGADEDTAIAASEQPTWQQDQEDGEEQP